MGERPFSSAVWQTSLVSCAKDSLIWLDLEESSLFQQTNVFEIKQPYLIDTSFEIRTQSNPMMRFLRAVSTTSLVTTCIMSRSIKRIFPLVMRRIYVTWNTAHPIY
jgi:hypothetical protein